MKRRVSALLALVAITLGGCTAATSTQPRELTVEFATGTSLFDNAPVRVRGVDVGRVLEVRPVGDHVEATLAIEHDVALPADSGAAVLPLSVLGERYVQLVAGEADDELEDGDRIPRSRTSTPAELDDLLEGLDRLTRDVDEQQLARTTSTLADVLRGNGERFGTLLTATAGTVELVASEADQLEALVTDLAALSSAIAGRGDTVVAFARSYRRLTDVLVSEHELLGEAVTATERSLDELGRLLVDHREAIADQLAVVTTTGRTAARNQELLADLVASTARLFPGSLRAYDPELNVVRVHPHADDPSLTSEVVSSRMLDRLRGICRRVARYGLDVPLEAVACAEGDEALLAEVVTELPDLFRQLSEGGPS